MPKCFTEGDGATLSLLKVRSSHFWLPVFLGNYSSCACLFQSGLNCPSFEHPNCLVILNVCLMLPERHVNQKPSLQLDSRLSGKLYIHIYIYIYIYIYVYINWIPSCHTLLKALEISRKLH